MGNIYHRDSGVWSGSLTKQPHYKNGPSWVPVKRWHVMVWEPDPFNIGEYIKTWVLVRSWVPPTQNVPNVSFTQTSLAPPEITIAWTTRGVNDDEYTYGVRVRWYVNGVHTYTDNVGQGTGSITREFSGFSQVHADICYTNPIGNGPLTTTSTINV